CGVLECVVRYVRELGGDLTGSDLRYGGSVANYRGRPQRLAVAGRSRDVRLHERGDHDRRLIDPGPLGSAANHGVASSPLTTWCQSRVYGAGSILRSGCVMTNLIEVDLPT